jgi:small neutral amino acid transporter SnatA (MarC family)
MDRLIDLYNNFYEWYVGLWYSILGEDGVNIIQGIMGVVFFVVCFVGVYMMVEKIEKYFEKE